VLSGRVQQSGRASEASGPAGPKGRAGEQIAKEQVMEMHPVLRGFFGAE
jgi:hypothetical protein